MATDSSKIFMGPGVFSYGAWVTAGGAGTLADGGHIRGPVTKTINWENYKPPLERSQFPVIAAPSSGTCLIKVPLIETTPDLLAVCMRQLAANLSGTAPNKTLRVGNPISLYYQATIVGTSAFGLATAGGGGGGTNGIRTLTFWKLQVQSIAEIMFGKGVEQGHEITFEAFLDETVTTADKLFKQVDS